LKEKICFACSSAAEFFAAFCSFAFSLCPSFAFLICFAFLTPLLCLFSLPYAKGFE